MKITNWEYEEISTIIIKTYDFFFSKGYVISDIEKNSRDGGYVSYTNQFGTTKIIFYFLTSYEVEVITQPNFLKGLIKFLFSKKPVEKYFSLKTKLRGNKEIHDFKNFIDEVKVYLIKNNLV